VYEDSLTRDEASIILEQRPGCGHTAPAQSSCTFPRHGLRVEGEMYRLGKDVLGKSLVAGEEVRRDYSNNFLADFKRAFARVDDNA